MPTSSQQDHLRVADEVSVNFVSVQVIYNRNTYQSCGFGFVTMSTVEEAERAVTMFHRYVSILYILMGLVPLCFLNLVKC